jgi:hypothetical protein
MSVKELIIATILMLAVIALFFWMGMILGDKLIKAPLIREWRAYHEVLSRFGADRFQYDCRISAMDSISMGFAVSCCGTGTKRSPYENADTASFWNVSGARAQCAPPARIKFLPPFPD